MTMRSIVILLFVFLALAFVVTYAAVEVSDYCSIAGYLLITSAMSLSQIQKEWLMYCIRLKQLFYWFIYLQCVPLLVPVPVSILVIVSCRHLRFHFTP